MEVSGFEF